MVKLSAVCLASRLDQMRDKVKASNLVKQKGYRLEERTEPTKETSLVPETEVKMDLS